MKCNVNLSVFPHIFTLLRKWVYLPSLQPAIKIQLKHVCSVYTAMWKEESWWPPVDTSFTHCPGVYLLYEQCQNVNLIYAEKNEIWIGFVFRKLARLVVIHVPQLNVTTIEDNYANMSKKKRNKNTYFHHSHCKKSCQKRPK